MQTYNKKQISSGSCLLIDTTAGNRKNYAWGLTNQTNRWLCRVSGAIAVSLAMSLLAATQALAGNFSITKIARADPSEVETPAPIPVEDAFALSSIVDTNTSIPDGSGNFTGFNIIATIDNDDVVFYGNSGVRETSNQGIYKNSGGILSTIADKNTPIPGGTGTFTYLNVVGTDGVNVVFTGDPNQQQGIYIQSGDAPIEVVADKNTPIPNGTGNFSRVFPLFSTLHSSVVSYSNNVAFNGFGTSGQQGIYLSSDGNLLLVADTNTPIPNGTGNFTNIFTNPLLKENNVVFRATGASGQQGIYISRNGTLQVIVDKNTTVPGSTSKFTSFDKYAVAGDAVAFVGSVNNMPLGIYVNIGGSLFKVADLSTSLDGKRISDLSSSSISLEGSSLAFTATFTDGTQAILNVDLSAHQSPALVP